jgi:Domain of unknown function (DUF2382)
MDPDGHLSEAEEQQLWRHYGLDYEAGYAAGTAGYADTDRGTYDRGTYDRDTVGRDVSGPTTDANIDAATSGPDITEAEHEVTLREEEPVVEKRTVPKERVRLDTDTVTEERQVGEEVRKEQIEVEGDRDRLRDDPRP